MIEKEYALDENTADGSVLVVVGSQAAIDLIDGFLPDEDVRFASHEAAQARLTAARAEKLELDNAERQPPQAAINELQDKLSFKIGECIGLEASVAAWEGMLADARAERDRDVAELERQHTNLRKINADVYRAGLVKDEKIVGLEITRRAQQQVCNDLGEALAARASEVRNLKGKAGEQADRIIELEQSLAHAQRGFFARLFGKGER